MKYKIFISSVQSEFKEERTRLRTHIETDDLLKDFFECFVFERTAASDKTPRKQYSEAIDGCEIYLGLLGKKYGEPDAEGVAATEREFDYASEKYLERWVYVFGDSTLEREAKEDAFINKVASSVSRKRFYNIDDLLLQVNKSCVQFLKQQGKIESQDFDSSVLSAASLDDLANDSVKEFVQISRDKRGFPLRDTATVEKVLTHLHLLRDGKLVNSAILAFGKKPQQFFPSAVVKCAHFHGTIKAKPIPDYKMFEGTVFNMIDSAIDFTLSKLNNTAGTRDETNRPVSYEIPRAVIAEAITNAVVHRNYLSTGSVEVSVFQDRVEISNPGRLVPNLDKQKLKIDHGSYPVNPLLARCLYNTGDIDQYGTGTSDIFLKLAEIGLKEPEIDLDEGFKIILWRTKNTELDTKLGTELDTELGTELDSTQDKKVYEHLHYKLVAVLQGEMSKEELMDVLELVNPGHFKTEYLGPAQKDKVIVMTMPDKPTSRYQKYKLTPKGKKLQKKLENE